MLRRVLRPPRVILLVTLIVLKACSSYRPSGLGVHDGHLAVCPASPNCVSSEASGDHFVAPLRIVGDAQQAWRVVRAVLSEQSRTSIVEANEEYIYAECVSLIFRFVDDLELYRRPDSNVIIVRSASRAGSYDWGVNRRRVEALAGELRRQGVVE